MVSALSSELNGQCSSFDRDQRVVLFGRTLFSHSASLHPSI